MHRRRLVSSTCMSTGPASHIHCSPLPPQPCRFRSCVPLLLDRRPDRQINLRRHARGADLERQQRRLRHVLGLDHLRAVQALQILDARHRRGDEACAAQSCPYFSSAGPSIETRRRRHDAVHTANVQRCSCMWKHVFGTTSACFELPTQQHQSSTGQDRCNPSAVPSAALRDGECSAG